MWWAQKNRTKVLCINFLIINTVHSFIGIVKKIYPKDD